MFESLYPGARPKRFWMAMVVIVAIGAVGLLLMFGVMWHSEQ